VRLLRNFVRLFLLKVRHIYLCKIYGMDIADSARISIGAKLDKTYPKGIHIGDESYVASGAIIFAHDYSRDMHTETYIGRKCFIGANAIILPGIVIGDSVIVGSGSVVTKNVQSNSIIVGNPAKVIKTNIKTSKYGQISV